MKRTVAIVAVVVIAGAAGWYLTNHNKPAATTNTANMANTTDTMNMNTSGSGTSGSDIAQSTNRVVIQNFAFSPSSVRVRQGTTITWTNNDSITHTVTESDGQSGPNSGDLAPGKSYSFTFTKTGTYSYHCQIHPSMTGTVTVFSSAME